MTFGSVTRTAGCGALILLTAGCASLEERFRLPFTRAGKVETVEGINLSPAAIRDYRGTYQQDDRHKAFAISPQGAYGVSFASPSAADAARSALEQCMQDVRISDLECVVYDVNGRRILKLPVNLRRVR